MDAPFAEYLLGELPYQEEYFNLRAIASSAWGTTMHANWISAELLFNYSPRSKDYLTGRGRFKTTTIKDNAIDLRSPKLLEAVRQSIREGKILAQIYGNKITLHPKYIPPFIHLLVNLKDS